MVIKLGSRQLKVGKKKFRKRDEPKKTEPKRETIRLGKAKKKDKPRQKLGSETIRLTSKKPGLVQQAQEFKEEHPVAAGASVALATTAVGLGLGALIAGGGIPLADKAGFLGRTTGAASPAAASKAATAAAVKEMGGAGLYTVNANTLASTGSLLAKVRITPAGAAILIGAIGTYPFQGFIKEEALQTLSFGIKSAIQSGNLDLADEATAQVDEILNPSTWDQIISTIPYANVVAKLKDFYDAARTKNAIDKKIIEDMRMGESEDEKWERLRQEEAEQNQAAIDYYNEQRKLIVQWELEAKQAQRDKDAAFWAAERAKQRKLEEEDRQAIADFWIAYRKEVYKLQQDNRPSNLNFGLL